MFDFPAKPRRFDASIILRRKEFLIESRGVEGVRRPFPVSRRDVTWITVDAPTLPYGCLLAASLAGQIGIWESGDGNERCRRTAHGHRLMKAREAMMRLLVNLDEPTPETLAAVIARSQIVVQSQIRSAPPLPPGFDATDVAILDWIVAEGHRLGRGLVQM